MPVWLQIILASVPGVAGLVMATMHMGALRRDVHDLAQRAAGWDQAKLDLQYIRGKMEGRSEAQDLERLSAAPRRRLRSVSGTGQLE